MPQRPFVHGLAPAVLAFVVAEVRCVAPDATSATEVFEEDGLAAADGQALEPDTSADVDAPPADGQPQTDVASTSDVDGGTPSDAGVETGTDATADVGAVDAGDATNDDATLDDATLDDATLDDAALDDAALDDATLDDGVGPTDIVVPFDVDPDDGDALEGDWCTPLANCGYCHSVPGRSGAHAAHYADRRTPPLSGYGDLRTTRDYLASGALPASVGTAAPYAIGCGNCHPIDPNRHCDGVLEVELWSPDAPAGSLKALALPTATYAGGACTNVYCHGSGQATPTFVTSPPWTGHFEGDRCAGCHDNPPRYPSGGAGSTTANTHVVMADDGYELGHFGGLPGLWHGSAHGVAAAVAAPITCQACHYGSVDPSNVAPGGFYYLDTGGDYELDGGSLAYRCADCHLDATGAPAARAGRADPAHHVDGLRDVLFDPRTTLPAGTPGLPTGADRPAHPYWVRTSLASADGLPPGATMSGATWSAELSGARYDAATQTCSAIPCHLAQSNGGAADYEPLRWGTTPVGFATCNACHQY